MFFYKQPFRLRYDYGTSERNGAALRCIMKLVSVLVASRARKTPLPEAS